MFQAISHGAFKSPRGYQFWTRLCAAVVEARFRQARKILY